MSYTYKQLSNPSTNLIALLEAMNADGVQDALYKGSEPFEVLAAKAIFNSYGAIDNADIQALLDSISSTQGSILYRNASDWVALAPGTSGQALTTGGAGANPSWSTLAGALPSQTGNSGKLLTTDGTNASWASTITGATTFSNTAASTSTSTGAVIVGGGLGVAGAIYGGNKISVGTSHYSNSATAFFFGTLKVGGSGGQGTGTIVLGDDQSSSQNVGCYRGTTAMAVGGGNWLNLAGFDGVNITSGNAAFGSQTKVASFITTGMTVSPTTASTSTTTGALVVSGGLGVAGAGYFGQGIYTTASNSGSGAQQITAQNTAAAATGNFAEITLHTTSAAIGATNSARVRAVYTAAGATDLQFYTNSTNYVAINGSTGFVSIGSTVSSTSTASGALVVAGGIGAAGAANVGTYYGMVDGVTAPGATVGYAKIYVDTADGDLKVVFGDGTIKTIATDT